MRLGRDCEVTAVMRGRAGECQAGQCLMIVDRNWNGIGNGWKVYGKKLEIIGELDGGGGDLKGRQECAVAR